MSIASPASRGIIAALIAAVCYGLIPLFTLPIKNGVHFMSDTSILFYRFALAALIIGGVMLVMRRDFRITRKELSTLLYLAFLSDGSALFLIDGYNYMSSGAATTLHFMYPVFTALLMMFFYNEARRFSTIFAICMAVGGVVLLSYSPDEGFGDWRGVVIELISALCYALYLIRVNRSRVKNMEAMKLTFYVMLFGALIFAGEAVRQGEFQLISTATQGIDLLLLGVICTVVTNVALVAAVKNVGSTMTAVLGALEPLTAVVVGCWVFGEALTFNIVGGIGLILPAVLLIIFMRARTAPEQGA